MTPRPVVLAEQLRVLSSLFAGSSTGIVIADAVTGAILHVNPAFESATGRHADDLLGHGLESSGLWAREEKLAATRPVASAAVGEAGTGAAAAAWPTAPTARGSAAVEASIAETAAGYRFCVYHLGRDAPEITHDAELRAIFDSATIGIAYARTEPAPWHFVQCNPSFESMFGWDHGTLAGQPIDLLWPTPEAAAESRARVEHALRRGDAVDTEERLQRRDGSSFACRLRARLVDEDGGPLHGLIWLCEDVSEQRRVDAALQAAVTHAEASARAKSVFLAKVSHEIRTPLNSLLGLTHLACEAQTTPDEQARYLHQLHSIASSLRGLLNDTLDLTKIEVGRFELDVRVFSLRALLNDLVVSWWASARAQTLTLRCQFDAQAPDIVLGDAVRVRQILSNFISNALKFSSGGSVEIRLLRRGGDRLRFEVQDHGPGLDEDAQAHLFEPFAQPDRQAARRAGGTGLGLAICRELAQRMDGHVGVVSSPGQGACFWAELPLPNATQAVAMRATEERCEDDSAGIASQRALAGRRALVVEDDDVNLMLTEAVLRSWGLQVEHAHDGRAAVDTALAAQAAGRPFDYALLDLNMPVLGGIAAAQAIRRHAELRDLVMIGLTGSTSAQDRAAATQADMTALLTKPFDPPQLRALLLQHSPLEPAGS